MHDNDPVVITGIGLVTPLGIGRIPVWHALLEGRSGIAPITSFDASSFRTHIGGEVRDFDPATTVRRLDPTTLGRASQLAVAAAHLALDDSGDVLPAPERVGVVMGTTSGEPREIEAFNDAVVGDNGQRANAAAALIRRYPCHRIAGAVAAELELGGPNAMLPAACAAGSYAIAHAADLLRAGRADVMLAGGSDAFSRITYAGFARLGAIAPERCQPFDRDRQGMIPSEGAAVLVLERASDAQRRGARVWAQVAGYGLSCDAHHMTAAHPDGEGAARAMRAALDMAELDADRIDYVSAHGTGTPTNDRLETRAVKSVFGDRRVPVSSIKSMLGHTMGAASAIETAICALAVAENAIPPTIGFETPDPECDLDCVPNHARELPVRWAMNNAYAFGGTNASLILREAS
ncbi:MAG: beta-ketoacyl-[acyl-carrier-protein] synthase family protein [Acidobacteriota bacterium]